MRLAFACILALLAASSAALAQSPAPPEAAGILAQEVLPALEARRAAGDARAEAAGDYVAGRAGWEHAFPDLVDAPLGDPELLRMRLAAAHARGVARAAERVALPPGGLTENEIAAWRTSIAAAADAEDRADGAEVRFLSGLQAGLQRAPGLAEPAVAARLATLPKPPADPGTDVPPEVLVADEEAQALRAWRRAAWQAMTRPGDPALSSMVATALAALPVPSEPDAFTRIRIDGLHDRLVRVAPLLEPELAAEATDWIAKATVLPLAASPVAVVAAEDAAAEAEREAAEADDPLEGPIRQDTAAVRATIADLVRDEEIRRSAALEEIAGWQTEVARLRTALAEAHRRTALDPERQPSRDATYLDLRRVVATLHDAMLSRDNRLGWRAEPADPALESPGPSLGSEAAADHATALADLRRHRAERQANVTTETQAIVGLLIDAKNLRRTARSLSSASARLVGQRAYVPDLLEETRELPAMLAYHAERISRTARELPTLLMDVSTLYALASRSAELLAGVVLWWVLRQFVPTWLAAAARRLDEPDGLAPMWSRLATLLTEQLDHRRGFHKATPLVTDVGRRLVDLGFASVFAWWVPPARAGLDVFASLLLALAVWRLWPKVLGLLLATGGEDRPSVRIVEPRTLARLRRLVAWIVGWWVATHLASVILLDLLAADKVLQLVDAIAVVAGVAIAGAALWTWEPELRGAVSGVDSSRLARRAASPGRPWTRIPRAFMALSLILVYRIGRLLGEAVATSRNLRWVGTAMARRQLAQTEALLPLDDETRSRIESLDHGVPRQVDAAVARVIVAHHAWSVERRAGMIAVIAERGAGLGLVPALVEAKLSGTRTVRPPRRISDAREARAWLARSLGLPDDEQTFVSALARTPREAIVVQDAQLLFLRRAGGFDAVRWMLETMQATSEEHFWIWCSDARTWAFQQDAPGAVDLGVFRQAVRIDPLRPEDLDGWLLDPLAAAGWRVSFSALSRRSTDGPDPRAELRARRAYLRVLDDLSQGKAAIARQLWSASLRFGPDGAIEHAVPVLNEAAVVATLGEEDLFLLAALVTHAGLDVDALSEVLNRPETRVRSACRRLATLGILAGDEQESWFDVVDNVHPTAVRVLTQRAFLDVT